MASYGIKLRWAGRNTSVSITATAHGIFVAACCSSVLLAARSVSWATLSPTTGLYTITTAYAITAKIASLATLSSTTGLYTLTTAYAITAKVTILATLSSTTSAFIFTAGFLVAAEAVFLATIGTTYLWVSFFAAIFWVNTKWMICGATFARWIPWCTAYFIPWTIIHYVALIGADFVTYLRRHISYLLNRERICFLRYDLLAAIVLGHFFA